MTAPRLLLNTVLSLDAARAADWSGLLPGLEVAEVPGPLADLDGAGVEVLVSGAVPDDLARWPDLRWLQLTSAGADQLRGQPIVDTEIAITTASGAHGVPIAEFVTAAWLMMLHRMPEALEFGRSRSWPDRTGVSASTARGKTAGIIGYGAIGRECARQLHALGMRVVCAKSDPGSRADRHFNAWPGTGDPDGSIPEAWYDPEQLDRLLAESDLVVVTVPSTPATAGIVGGRELAALKAGAHLIVVSRGGIVDEAALAAGLVSGRIAGGLVDCYAQEPPSPDDPLFDVPNLLMTPHVSGIHDGFPDALLRLVDENLRRLVTGEPLLNLVDKTIWRNA